MSVETSHAPTAGTHRVVIVGSGFGGLFAAKALRKAPVEITLLSSTAYHLFQPLLYQVATGILSEGEVAPATREVLHRQRQNTEVLLGTVTDVDLAARTVTSTSVAGERVTPYDSLIVAAGAGQSYFGNDHFAEFAPGMKSIDDALELRGRIYGAFELAELQEDPAVAAEWQTFVIVGAGATGVEMAGQIAELAKSTLRRDFRNIDPTKSRILLLDAAPVMLPAFGEKLANEARRRLEKLGVEVELGLKVVGVDATGVDVVDAQGKQRRIAARTKVWAAGVGSSPLGRRLAEQSGAEVDRSGRVKVRPDLTLPGHPEVFVVGDMISLDGLPGVAQVAMQGGTYAAKQIRRRLAGEPADQPFHYRDKGSMAIVSRLHAVAMIGPLRVSGFPAWLLWLGVHLVYLVGFKNRVTTLLHWAITFFSNDRQERTATHQQVFARNTMARFAAIETSRPTAAAARTTGSAAQDGPPPAPDGLPPDGSTEIPDRSPARSRSDGG
jgi:NADH dehydrogenase